MPIYEYEARDAHKSCGRCRNGFEYVQGISDAPLAACPECGAPVRKLVSRPAVGSSKSNLDQRARSAGFHKLRRLGKGEYEKQY